MEHTKGKWEFRFNQNSKETYIEVFAPPQDGTKTHINIVCQLHERHYNNDPYSQEDNIKANARLISAAPEMLEVLKEVLSRIETLPFRLEAQIERVIKKTTI